MKKQIMKHIPKDVFDDDCDEVKQAIEKIKKEIDTCEYQDMNGEENDDPINWFIGELRSDIVLDIDEMLEKK